MHDLKEIRKYSHSLNLLYVEDNKEARESSLTIFELFFDNIIVAVDGEDGLNKFRENSIDLIITDINMPKMNGLEMIGKIREINKDMLILVLSAYTESGFFMDSIKLGVEGYILKPIEEEQFLTLLSKIIQKAKLKQESEENLNFLNQYQEITDKSSIISKTDLNGIITYANDEFCKIYEYSKDELIGQNHNIIKHPDNPPSLFKELWNTIRDKKAIWQGIIKNISKTGKIYYSKSTIKPILDKNGNIIEYITLRDDVTDIMNQKKQLGDFIHDTKEPLVAYIKLEEFDTLEEFYGHSMIEVIQDKISKYLIENMPDVCDFEKVYQLGNGEYAFAQEKHKCKRSEQEIISGLKRFQENIRNSTVDVGVVDYDMSIIISLAYKDAQVLESAKLGIKEAVDKKQDFIISNNLARREHDKAQENIKTISMVKKALSSFKIASYFQPIVNNKTKQIEKYESLVRLIDENDSVISPFFFLEIAKKGRYYSQITSTVLDNSFDALKDTDKSITINLSVLDIEKKSTREKLFKLLNLHKERASRVIFELLEDEGAKDFNTIKKFIHDVKLLGTKIAIDDFGAGYSNFERLLDYQPDILKIDGSLIKNIVTDDFSLDVVETIVTFAKKQNIKIVAEFVENEEIFNVLKELGIDYSQGYYFGKPDILKQ